MVWTSVSPNGTISTGANVPIMAANTVYTETTLNVDHYWNIGNDEDGHHSKVEMPAQAADITLDTGMDGGIYVKETSYGENEVFFRNSSAIYQMSPTFLTGSVVIAATGQNNIVAVPDSCYGNIMLFQNNSTGNSQWGWFVAAGGNVKVYSPFYEPSGSSTGTTKLNLKFNNDGGAALTIRARNVNAGAGTYQYRVMLWDI